MLDPTLHLRVTVGLVLWFLLKPIRSRSLDRVNIECPFQQLSISHQGPFCMVGPSPSSKGRLCSSVLKVAGPWAPEHRVVPRPINLGLEISRGFYLDILHPKF